MHELTQTDVILAPITSSRDLDEQITVSGFMIEGSYHVKGTPRKRIRQSLRRPSQLRPQPGIPRNQRSRVR